MLFFNVVHPGFELFPIAVYFFGYDYFYIFVSNQCGHPVRKREQASRREIDIDKLHTFGSTAPYHFQLGKSQVAK